jgi:hypothetical protein
MAVKCSDCGFLSLRNLETNTLDEADEDCRKSGAVYKNKYPQPPICFKNAFDLRTEIGSSGSVPEDATNTLKVLNKDRECLKHTLWKPGYTPKEHQAMIDSESLLRFQEEQRERDRAWQQRQNWLTRLWGLICIVVGVLLGYFLKG